MAIYKVEVKKILKGTLIWAIVLGALLFMYMAFFPSMADAGFSELLDEKMNLLPEGLLKSFGLDEMPNFANFMEYYSYVMQFILLGLGCYSLILGVGSLAKEEGEKTLEFLYAKPITRNKIIINKVLAALTSLFIVIGTLLLISLISSLIWNDAKQLMMLISVAKIAFIPIITMYFVGLLISSFLRSYSKGIGLSLGIFFGTYILGIISQTVEKLDFLKYFSPMNYLPMQDIYRYLEGTKGMDLNIVAIIICIVIIIISISGTFIKYNRKDFY